MKSFALALGLCLCASCARDPAMKAWSDRWLVAERALSEGRHAEARDRFLALEASALTETDRVEMVTRRAEAHRRAGQLETTTRLLDGLVRNSEELDPELRAKLRWQYARSLVDLGRHAEAERRMEQLIDLQPDSAFATRAFVYLRDVFRQRDKVAFVSWCRQKYAAHFDSVLADNFVYEAALVYYEAGPEAWPMAETLYRKVLDRWKFETSGLWDDALWELSLIYHQQQRWHDELDLLRRLLGTRETTWLGSQQIENYRHAYLRIGRVTLEGLGKPLEAAAHFGRFPTIWTTSVLIDDALWLQAKALRVAGDLPAAKRVEARILRDYPEGKYARRLREGQTP